MSGLAFGYWTAEARPMGTSSAGMEVGGDENLNGSRWVHPGTFIGHPNCHRAYLSNSATAESPLRCVWSMADGRRVTYEEPRVVVTTVGGDAIGDRDAASTHASDFYGRLFSSRV